MTFLAFIIIVTLLVAYTYTYISSNSKERVLSAYLLRPLHHSSRYEFILMSVESDRGAISLYGNTQHLLIPN